MLTCIPSSPLPSGGPPAAPWSCQPTPKCSPEKMSRIPVSAQPAAPGSALDGVRGWRPAAVVAAVAAVAAVGAQLWGVYRVTGPPEPPWLPDADKLEHAVGFGLPVVLIMVTAVLRGVHSARLRRVGLVTGLAFIGHGVVSEIIQHTFY